MTAVEPYRTTRAELDILREKIAPDASDADLRYLGAVAQRLGLDPIAGHVVLIGRWDSRAGRQVFRPQVTAEGRLVVADRSGELEGIDGPEWCGPRNRSGGHDWLEVWDDEQPPHAARCFVHRRGWTRPVNGTVRWAEFAQRDSKGNLTPTWKQMPSHMLGKTALSLGLRRAFPGLIPADVDMGDDFDSDQSPPAVEQARPKDAPPPSAGPPLSDRQRQQLRDRWRALDDAGQAEVRNRARTEGLPWPLGEAHAADYDTYDRLLADAERAGWVAADLAETWETGRNIQAERSRPVPRHNAPDRDREGGEVAGSVGEVGQPGDNPPDHVMDDQPEANTGEDGSEHYDPDDMRPFQ